MSVAPIMDWTDGRKTALEIKRLGVLEIACLHFVFSNSGCPPRRAPEFDVPEMAVFVRQDRGIDTDRDGTVVPRAENAVRLVPAVVL